MLSRRIQLPKWRYSIKPGDVANAHVQIAGLACKEEHLWTLLEAFANSSIGFSQDCLVRLLVNKSPADLLDSRVTAIRVGAWTWTYSTPAWAESLQNCVILKGSAPYKRRPRSIVCMSDRSDLTSGGGKERVGEHYYSTQMRAVMVEVVVAKYRPGAGSRSEKPFGGEGAIRST